jgi:pimeloyl-ACP methyl ester carboxylesterase
VPRRHRGLRRYVLRADPAQEYLLYVPRSGIEQGRLFVSIHGISRNADQHARLLSAYCELYRTALVAPIFSAEEYPDYQRLGRTGRGKRADIALNMIVAEAATLTGVSAERFHLFGYSGGAQFAHRFLMANPHRVAAAVIAAAGWYTWPDPTRRFPYGTRMSRRLPDVRFDAEDYLCVPITVMVGADDDEGSGLRRNPRLDREQGATRVERARRWVAAMRAAAHTHHLQSQVTYVEVENCSHSFRHSVLRAGLGDKVFRVLFGASPARVERVKT